MHIAIYTCRICSYKVVEYSLFLSIRQTQTCNACHRRIVTHLLIGDYHKVVVSCVSYSWPYIYDCRVSCKDIALDLNVLSDSLFMVANACNCTKLVAK